MASYSKANEEEFRVITEKSSTEDFVTCFIFKNESNYLSVKYKYIDAENVIFEGLSGRFEDEFTLTMDENNILTFISLIGEVTYKINVNLFTLKHTIVEHTEFDKFRKKHIKEE